MIIGRDLIKSLGIVPVNGHASAMAVKPRDLIDSISIIITVDVEFDYV